MDVYFEIVINYKCFRTTLTIIMLTACIVDFKNANMFNCVYVTDIAAISCQEIILLIINDSIVTYVYWPRLVLNARLSVQ